MRDHISESALADSLGSIRVRGSRGIAVGHATLTYARNAFKLSSSFSRFRIEKIEEIYVINVFMWNNNTNALNQFKMPLK